MYEDRTQENYITVIVTHLKVKTHAHTHMRTHLHSNNTNK